MGELRNLDILEGNSDSIVRVIAEVPLHVVADPVGIAIGVGGVQVYAGVTKRSHVFVVV